jgi:hypothetical protein
MHVEPRTFDAPVEPGTNRPAIEREHKMAEDIRRVGSPIMQGTWPQDVEFLVVLGAR